MGIIDRISSLSETEAAKALNFAHEKFQARRGAHGHQVRAILESIADVCREHPAIVGAGVGLAIDAVFDHLERVQREEEARSPQARPAPRSAPAPDPTAVVPLRSESEGPHFALPQLPHFDMPDMELPKFDMPDIEIPKIEFDKLRPGKIALEVFGALVLLKFGRGVMRAMRKNRPEPWFAGAAKIRLFSGSLAAYYLAKSLKSPKVSAWRNAAVALFATDALKPLLKAPPPLRP
jgi:hypothetical protein